MGRLRCAWGLGVHLATLACLATLFGCGGEEEHAFELDRIRPPRGGEQCDQTWRGPSEDEAVAATLFLNRGVVRPGGRLWAAIENRGATALETGIAPKVKRRVEGEWVDQVFPGTDSLLAAYTIERSTVSPCLGVRISKTWKPGLYRVNFEVSASGSLDQVEGPGFPSYFRIRGR